MNRQDSHHDKHQAPSHPSPLTIQSEALVQLNHNDLTHVWGANPTDSQTSNAGSGEKTKGG